MFKPVQVKPDVYWVGAVDWMERSFHGYTTDRGSTYNAYLILDDEPTLIDTVKVQFSDQLIERISAIIDPAQIKHVVSNHVEEDHSGAIPRIMALCPDADLITSSPHGETGLRAHFGDDLPYRPVKTGDTLCIGKHTLAFVATVMVHWPDNMVTYDAYDKILFSNDAFGQHFATDCRFDDEVDVEEAFYQARKYYSNIVMPYGFNVGKTLEVVDGLDLDMIAPCHGVIWRANVSRILSLYHEWCAPTSNEAAVVVYDSMWHATEKMALAAVDAFVRLGIPCRLFDLKVDHISDVMPEILTSRYLAVGSPTLNSGMLPTVAWFLTYLKGLSPRTGWKGRAAIPFGSYGWAPLGQKEVADMIEKSGYEMPLGTISHQWAMSDDELMTFEQQLIDGITAFRS
jgi:flavorubredoxin